MATALEKPKLKLLKREPVMRQSRTEGIRGTHLKAHAQLPFASQERLSWSRRSLAANSVQVYSKEEKGSTHKF